MVTNPSRYVDWKEQPGQHYDEGEGLETKNHGIHLYQHLISQPPRVIRESVFYKTTIAENVVLNYRWSLMTGYLGQRKVILKLRSRFRRSSASLRFGPGSTLYITTSKVNIEIWMKYTFKLLLGCIYDRLLFG